MPMLRDRLRPRSAGGSRLRHLALALGALKENTDEAGAHKKEIDQLNGWFEIALHNMARGLSMFDAEQKLIVCNRMYREIFDLPERLTRRGTPLADIVRYRVQRETGSDTLWWMSLRSAADVRRGHDGSQRTS